MTDWRDEARAIMAAADPFFRDLHIARRADCPLYYTCDQYAGLGGPLIGARLTGRPGVPGIIIDDEAIERTSAGATPEELRWRRLGIVVHECAHVVQFGREALEQGHPLDKELIEAVSDAIASGEWPQPNFDHEGPRWAGHGHQFHRAVLHLYARANKNGANLRLPFFHIGEPYGLPAGVDLLSTLRAEIDRLADLSIFDALAAPPAADFCRLWHLSTGEQIERN